MSKGDSVKHRQNSAELGGDLTDLTARITEILRSPDYSGHLLAPKIAAAAEEHYRPRIETPEQLDALPVGAIVADLHCDLTPPPIYVRFIDGWSLDGLKVKPGRRNLTVLWSPGAGE